MEIILAKTCQSLTGSLNRQHGYFIRQQGQRFFGQRSPKNHWPKGHLAFILDLAKMANSLIVSDIRVPAHGTYLIKLQKGGAVRTLKIMK